MWSYCVRHFISKFQMSIGHCWDLWNRKKAGGFRWNHCPGRWNSDPDFGYYRALTGKCPSNVPQDDPQGVAQDVAQGKNVSEDVGSSNRTSTGQVQPHKLPPQVHPTSTRQVTPQVKADKYRTSYDLFCNCFAGDCNEPFILINFGRKTSGRVGENYITYGDIKSISGSAPLLKKCRFERNFCSGLTFHTGEKERENPDKKRENPAFWHGNFGWIVAL